MIKFDFIQAYIYNKDMRVIGGFCVDIRGLISKSTVMIGHDLTEDIVVETISYFFYLLLLVRFELPQIRDIIPSRRNNKYLVPV